MNSDADNAVRIAKSILDRSTPAFLGCKQLYGPLCRLGLADKDAFITIKGIESDLDESPIWPQERQLRNLESLAREDAKLASWLPQAEPGIFKACEAIIAHFAANH